MVFIPWNSEAASRTTDEVCADRLNERPPTKAHNPVRSKNFDVIIKGFVLICLVLGTRHLGKSYITLADVVKVCKKQKGALMLIKGPFFLPDLFGLSWGINAVVFSESIFGIVDDQNHFVG